MGWRIFAASVTGKSHTDAGLPCQDAWSGRVAGDVLVAAVCDGAGSQPMSHRGACLLSRSVINGLCQALEQEQPIRFGSEAWVAGALKTVIQQARATLEDIAAGSEHSIHAYAATLVGVIANHSEGWFFHIGDGQAVALLDADGTTTVKSLPENGEYSNETYFATGAEWAAHLRLTRIPAGSQVIALMSDGTASFALSRTGELFRPFFDPVIRYLATIGSEQGSAALTGTLSDPRTHGITGDDKTLLIAFPI